MASTETASSSLVQLASGASSEAWEREHPRGKLRLHWSTSGAVRMHVVGRGASEFAPLMIKRCEAAVRECGSVLILFDLPKMQSYDTELRQWLIEWSLANRRAISAMHFYAESSVVLMGARVAGLMLRGLLEIHTHRDAFDRVVRDSGLPPPLA